MNEVTKIHLGRQAFTISLTAHKQLREYLDAIEQQVGARGEEVIKEVELRMAELLLERGITGEKVVLPDDVTFLKTQLGEPNDFRDEEDDTAATDATSKENPGGQKRLFRDTDHGMLAGVSAGLATYFGIDTVIVRLIFVVLTLLWGWGALVYILLWLIVPEAKTNSERLQMRGVPVTVDSLKEIVDRADMPGAARRANRAVAGIAGGVSRAILAIIGIGFLAAAFVTFLATVGSGTYLLVHGSEAGGAIVFPLGTQEVLVVVSAIVALVALAALLAVVGVSCLRRKWSLPGWALAVLVVGTFTAAAMSTALALDAVPAVRERYEKLNRTQTVTLPAFTAVDLTGQATDFVYQPDSRSYVELRYFGSDRSLPVKPEVINNTLTVDASRYIAERTCDFLCLYNDERLEVIIHAPTLEAISIKGSGSFTSNKPLAQESLQLTANRNIQLDLLDTAVKVVEVGLDNGTGNFRLQLHGLQKGESSVKTYYDGLVYLSNFNQLKLTAPEDACRETDPRIYINESGPVSIVINGQQLQSVEALRTAHSITTPNAYNCVVSQ